VEPAILEVRMSATPENGVTFDVVGLGNAIVDVFAEVGDPLIERAGLMKGTMHLVDQAGMEALYQLMPPGVEMSGGSCANTMAALASLGARAGYIGKVQADQLGRIFAHDIRASGVRFETRPLKAGPPTARSLILVGPDAQRTMATFLGACVELGPADVDARMIGAAKITYLEGYLWDRPEAKAACLEAAAIAHAHGRKVALTLSDPFCVDRWRDEFVPLIEEHVDILIANEAEITSLFQVAGFEAAVPEAARRVEIAALTRGPRGSIVIAEGKSHTIQAVAPERVLDTTGAGDLFAAGLLYGLSHALGPEVAGRLGSLAAGCILGQFGARPRGPLAPLVAEVTGH
jgi:sugar/nucleoside kinase (ribokinase family)